MADRPALFDNIANRNRWNCERKCVGQIFQENRHPFQWPKQSAQYDHWIEDSCCYEIRLCMRFTDYGYQEAEQHTTETVQGQHGNDCTVITAIGSLEYQANVKDAFDALNKNNHRLS